MAEGAREQLVHFLERRAFRPVLEASEDSRSAADKRRLADVKDATRAEVERFRHYGSAREVVVNFRRDLDSEPAEKIHRELAALGLPTINDIRDEFERKARDLGVEV